MRATLRENLLLALSTINTHKLRSALTILGVVIGTTCVIAIGSILTGMNNNVVELLQQYGTETIFVSKWEEGPRTRPSSREERTRKQLSWTDYEAVLDGCTACRVAGFETWVNTLFSARYKDQVIDTLQFSGDTPQFAEALNFDFAEGRYFTQIENEHRSNVCVIGDGVRKTFFPRGGALGQEIRVNGYSCRIIGVLKPFKSFALESGDQRDKFVQIPFQTFAALYPQYDKPSFMAAQAYSGMREMAVDQIRAALRRSRKVPPRAADSFGLATSDSIIEQFHAITGAIALVMIVISSIGLLVGGVGVMNIMLMSVTERTREIGVRKAIGARRRDIILQFLLEACALTATGGLMGIIVGSLISVAMRAANPDFPTTVPMWAVAAGFLVSVSVGLFFGMWPAVKAAKLDPVEALRYE